MADKSKIEWTDASWNPVRARNRKSGRVGWFCTHDSEGCRNCYAEGMNNRLGAGLPYKPGHLGDLDIFLDETMLTQPLRWRAPRKIFVGSMTDLFGVFVETVWLDRIFAVAALCPQHTFIVLTKRAKRMREYFAGIEEDPTDPSMRDALIEGAAQAIYVAQGHDDDPSLWLAVHMPLPNVWLGVSCEDQANADQRIPDLLATPAAVRFVSAEPLLSAINFTKIGRTACLANAGACCGDKPWLDSLRGIQGCSRAGAYSFPLRSQMPHGLDWIITGGESGAQARPMHPDWARRIRDQCVAAGVPFFFKQWGEFREHDNGSTRITQVEDDSPLAIATLATAVNPCWITLSGRFIRKHRDLPLAGHEPARLIERVGKKAAGRALDGATHDAFPSPRSHGEKVARSAG